MHEHKAIPKHRLDYIDLVLREYIRLFDIKKWPIDCVALIKEMQSSDKFPVQIGSVKDISSEFDAVTRYVPESGVYQLILNHDKIQYPFRKSSDRRLNFTIAHEIGHIVLEHLCISDELKSDDERNIENLEADEFAGRFLMPKKLIFSCNYYSIDAVAAFINVSNAALKKRLENLARTDIIKSSKVKSCTKCGNTRFSTFAEYCGICGQSIRGGLKGIQRIYYPEEIPMDQYKRALVCPFCKKDLSNITGDKCIPCGTYIFNFCSDFFNQDNGKCSYANLGNSRYCEICGKPTYYYKKDYLSTWQNAFFSEYQNAVAEEHSMYTSLK